MTKYLLTASLTLSLIGLGLPVLGLVAGVCLTAALVVHGNLTHDEVTE